MNPYQQEQLNRLKAAVDATAAPIPEAQATYHALKAEYDALRLKAKTEEPGDLNASSYADRLWELDARQIAQDALCRRLVQQHTAALQAVRDFERVNGLRTYVEARLI